MFQKYWLELCSGVFFRLSFCSSTFKPTAHRKLQYSIIRWQSNLYHYKSVYIGIIFRVESWVEGERKLNCQRLKKNEEKNTLATESWGIVVERCFSLLFVVILMTFNIYKCIPRPRLFFNLKLKNIHTLKNRIKRASW